MQSVFGSLQLRHPPQSFPGGTVAFWRADDAGFGDMRVMSVVLMLSPAATEDVQLSDGMDTVAALPADPAWVGERARVIHVRIGSADGTQCLQRSGEPHDPWEAPAPATLARDPVIKRLRYALDAAEKGDGRLQGIYAGAIRFAIVARLLSLQSPGAPAASRRHKTGLPKWRLKQVIDHIDANLAETITLADLAAAAGLSPMHFAAQFRLATGVRPHEFVMRRRVARSQQLLAETHETLVEIALSVGFQTQAHFTTVFKRFVGDTPRQWRCARYESSL